MSITWVYFLSTYSKLKGLSESWVGVFYDASFTSLLNGDIGVHSDLIAVLDVKLHQVRATRCNGHDADVSHHFAAFQAQFS